MYKKSFFGINKAIHDIKFQSWLQETLCCVLITIRKPALAFSFPFLQPGTSLTITRSGDPTSSSSSSSRRFKCHSMIQEEEEKAAKMILQLDFEWWEEVRTIKLRITDTFQLFRHWGLKCALNIFFEKVKKLKLTILALKKRNTVHFISISFEKWISFFPKCAIF